MGPKGIMAAAANLTLKNDAGTNVTFSVFGVYPDSAEWTEDGATSILGTSRFVLGRKIPQNRVDGVYRTTGKLTRPVLNSTDPSQLDGTVTFTFEILRPAKLAKADVDELVARAKEAIALAIVKAAAETGAIPT